MIGVDATWSGPFPEVRGSLAPGHPGRCDLRLCQFVDDRAIRALIAVAVLGEVSERRGHFQHLGQRANSSAICSMEKPRSRARRTNLSEWVSWSV
jgi:hypothetical protein